MVRTRCRGDRLPAVLGGLAAVTAIANLASALTPGLASRISLLEAVMPDGAADLAHALSVPASAALLVVAWSLVNRRRRGYLAAVALLVTLGLLNLIKGLDVEEALVSWGLAGLLIWGRRAFHVAGCPHSARAALARLPVIALGVSAVAVATAWLSRGFGPDGPSDSFDPVARGFEILSGAPSPADIGRPQAMLLHTVAALVIVAFVVAVAPFFRALAPSAAHVAQHRRRALSLVRLHGTDTLSFFTMRKDVSYLFSPDARGFLAYRVESGVMMVSGDPVGPPDALPAVVRAARTHADLYGLRLGVVGARTEMRDLWARAGLKSLYLGDEALIDTAAFSLTGRPIRKVRQSVTRLTRAGFTTELRELGDLTDGEIGALERIAREGLEGKPERGFSMALDQLGGPDQTDSLVVIARDDTGVIRGFLHFVPCYGRSAVSLSFMRRQLDTPNGLTEFMICHAIEALGRRDVREVSLNFAAFARLMHAPQSLREKLFGAILRRFDRTFAVESLYRFNARFFPRWEPRYLCFCGPFGLVRTGLAALWVEGQVPKPVVTGRRREPAREHALIQ